MRLAVRVPRDALALRRVQSLSATPPSAELLGDRKAGMQVWACTGEKWMPIVAWLWNASCHAFHAMHYKRTVL
eukprot:SAG11_NODE_578_length_8373_cov_28.044471_7_plen_73_part_00